MNFLARPAAMILRKLGRPDQEMPVLQRWIDHCPEKYKDTKFDQKRLKKLKRRISSKKAPTELER